MSRPGTIIDVALGVLNTPLGDDKATLTLEALDAWRRGALGCPSSGQLHDTPRRAPTDTPPDMPARDPKLNYVLPHLVPKRGKGGTLQSRMAYLHALVHIEACAVDLAWDIIARFGLHDDYRDVLPTEFYEEFLVVAADEARHYTALKARLEELGGMYGDLAVHEGLWDSARRTKDRLEARLAVEHATHEARGLDVLPSTIDKFARNGDAQTATLLENVILPEEIGHCAAGIKWIKYLFGLRDEAKYAGRTWAQDARRFERVEDWFHALVRGHFDGNLKPPFNKTAREEAGFSEAWYLPLAEG